MAEKKESIEKTSRGKKNSRKKKGGKSDFKPFYAAVSETYLAATCKKREEVISSLKKQGARRSKFNIYKVYVDENSRCMFSLSLDGEQQFDLKNIHWDRLYREIYHFLKGIYRLNPELKSRTTKGHKSGLAKRITDALRS